MGGRGVGSSEEAFEGSKPEVEVRGAGEGVALVKGRGVSYSV